MHEDSSQIDKYLLGVTILAALVFGGGTEAGLTTDMGIQLLAVATSTAVCIRRMNKPIDRRVFWFLVVAFVSLLLQVLPISTEQIRATQGILPREEIATIPAPMTISLGLGRTIEVAGFFATLSLFLVAVLKLRFDQLYGLIPFFLAGVVLNLTAGLIQYSYTDRAVVTDIFQYDLNAGFFVNVNHYSSLIFASIPIAFVYFIESNRLVMLLLYITVALLILLAAGSAAGVFIGFAITVLSIVILFQRQRTGILVALAGTVMLGIYTIGLWARVQAETFDREFGRSEFAQTTIRGILDNLPFGIGYGNFLIAYPSYERSEMIFSVYVNHAHNDYLELIFEGGIFAAALIGLFLVLLVWRFLETIHLPLHKAATLSILFILVHSIVDYPLRTLALAFTFTMFVGFLFHRGPEAIEKPKSKQSASPREMAVEDLG
ncbi:MAG: O-antigen ligase family protein [Pseudomonadota bacterium]